MCHFITATHSVNITLADLNKIAELFAFKFQDCSNEFVCKQIQENEKYISKFTKTCDCGTSIGESSETTNSSERIQISEINKLKKKDWSDAKINRWVADKKKIDEKINQLNETILNRKSDEIENWLSFIQTLFKLTNIEHFGILLHWYSKGLANENIKIVNRVIISYKNLTELDLKILHEDTLLSVTQ